MLRVDDFKLYDLGAKVHPVLRLTNEAKYEDIWYDLYEARTALEQAKNGPVPLTICSPAITKLLEQIEGIVGKDYREAATRASTGIKLETWQVFFLRQAAQEFETVLAAELQASASYFVSQKGAYSTADLIDRAELVFPESVRSRLPDQARKDIREAGRALAFGIPTAAGFHILRATEGVLVEYYGTTVGEPPPETGRNWGSWIEKLKTAPKASKKVTGFLQHLKDEYRNPVTHPEVFLSMDEVQVLLGAAVSAMTQMILEVQAIDTSVPKMKKIELAPRSSKSRTPRLLAKHGQEDAAPSESGPGDNPT